MTQDSLDDARGIDEAHDLQWATAMGTEQRAGRKAITIKPTVPMASGNNASTGLSSKLAPKESPGSGMYGRKELSNTS